MLMRGGTLAFSITHPCFISREGCWIRDANGVKTAMQVSHYFMPTPWIDRWRFEGAATEAPEFSVPRFDRTLSYYVNTLLDTGFVLDRIEEPRPPEAYCREHPSQRAWRDHAALFLHIRATKPAA